MNGEAQPGAPWAADPANSFPPALRPWRRVKAERAGVPTRIAARAFADARAHLIRSPADWFPAQLLAALPAFDPPPDWAADEREAARLKRAEYERAAADLLDRVTAPRLYEYLSHALAAVDLRKALAPSEAAKALASVAIHARGLREALELIEGASWAVEGGAAAQCWAALDHALSTRLSDGRRVKLIGMKPDGAALSTFARLLARVEAVADSRRPAAAGAIPAPRAQVAPLVQSIVAALSEAFTLAGLPVTISGGEGTSWPSPFYAIVAGALGHCAAVAMVAPGAGGGWATVLGCIADPAERFAALGVEPLPARHALARALRGCASFSQQS